MTHDVIILGAGMAGASLAAELAAHRQVLVLEMEDQPGRHATGRSAAMFFESYGNATVRALTRASRDFLLRPPDRFAAAPLMQRRDALLFAATDRIAALDAMFDQPDAARCLQRVDAAGALQRCPILRPERVAAAAIDVSGHDIDVAALHQGYIRQARHRGAQLLLGAGATALRRDGATWTAETQSGTFTAPVVVNATGAWADEVAALCGVPAIGLQPLRRTAVTLPAPAGHDIRNWPMVIDVDESLYFKPDAGQLLLSPANEDVSLPCDAAPDEMDVAVAVHRFEEATTVRVQKILHRWAGLRSFVADRAPVAGFDAAVPGFFWLAGQGGYGIQMAPALARAAAALAMERPLPDDLVDQGVAQEALSPARPRLRA